MTSQPELQTLTFNEYILKTQDCPNHPDSPVGSTEWVQHIYTVLHSYTRGSKIVVHVWVGSFLDSWLPPKNGQAGGFLKLELESEHFEV